MSYSTQRLLSAQLWLPGRASEPTPLDPLALADLAGQTVRLEETRVFLRDGGAKRTARFRKQLRRLVARRETLQAAGCDPDAPGSAAPDMSLRQLRQLPRAFGRKRNAVQLQPEWQEDSCSDWRLLLSHADAGWVEYWQQCEAEAVAANVSDEQRQMLYWERFQHYWFYQWQRQPAVKRYLKQHGLPYDGSGAGDEAPAEWTPELVRDVSCRLLENSLAALAEAHRDLGYSVARDEESNEHEVGDERPPPPPPELVPNLRGLAVTYIDPTSHRGAYVEQGGYGEALQETKKEATSGAERGQEEEVKVAVDTADKSTVAENESGDSGDEAESDGEGKDTEEQMNDADAAEKSEPTRKKPKIEVPPGVPIKYWMQRKRLFSKFNKGIKLDTEAWYSTTLEKIAEHHAYRCECDTIVDACCGVGGNAIQLARLCNHVIAIDIDAAKIECARHNAEVYGVAERIEFIVGDFVDVAKGLSNIDVVFLSPPWGGPQYLEEQVYDLAHVTPPIDKLMEACRSLSDNICLYLPRNTDVAQVVQLTKPGETLELEQNFLNQKLKTLTVYFNSLAVGGEEEWVEAAEDEIE